MSRFGNVETPWSDSTTHVFWHILPSKALVSYILPAVVVGTTASYIPNISCTNGIQQRLCYQKFKSKYNPCNHKILLVAI